MVEATYQTHAKRVHQELIRAGATLYGLMKSESRYVPHIIHEGEHIHAVVYGQHNSSSAMLIATDQRIIYLDKKPMASFMDEVTYDVVSGVEMDVHTLFATLTLHTAVTNYKIRYANIHCADTFTRYIETQKLRNDLQRKEIPEGPKAITIAEDLKNDLAGYYWIPKEEEKEVEAVH